MLYPVVAAIAAIMILQFSHRIRRDFLNFFSGAPSVLCFKSGAMQIRIFIYNPIPHITCIWCVPYYIRLILNMPACFKHTFFKWNIVIRKLQNLISHYLLHSSSFIYSQSLHAVLKIEVAIIIKAHLLCHHLDMFQSWHIAVV